MISLVIFLPPATGQVAEPNWPQFKERLAQLSREVDGNANFISLSGTVLKIVREENIPVLKEPMAFFKALVDNEVLEPAEANRGLKMVEKIRTGELDYKKLTVNDAFIYSLEGEQTALVGVIIVTLAVIWAILMTISFLGITC